MLETIFSVRRLSFSERSFGGGSEKPPPRVCGDLVSVATELVSVARGTPRRPSRALPKKRVQKMHGSSASRRNASGSSADASITRFMAVRPSEREYDSAPESLESRPASSAAARRARAACAAVSARSPLPPTRARETRRTRETEARRVDQRRSRRRARAPRRAAPPQTRSTPVRPAPASSVAAGTHCDHLHAPSERVQGDRGAQTRRHVAHVFGFARETRFSGRAGPGPAEREPARRGPRDGTGDGVRRESRRGAPRTGVPSTLSFHLIPTRFVFRFSFRVSAAFAVVGFAESRTPQRLRRLRRFRALDEQVVHVLYDGTGFGDDSRAALRVGAAAIAVEARQRKHELIDVVEVHAVQRHARVRRRRSETLADAQTLVPLGRSRLPASVGAFVARAAQGAPAASAPSAGRSTAACRARRTPPPPAPPPRSARLPALPRRPLPRTRAASVTKFSTPNASVHRYRDCPPGATAASPAGRGLGTNGLVPAPLCSP